LTLLPTFIYNATRESKSLKTLYQRLLQGWWV